MVRRIVANAAEYARYRDMLPSGRAEPYDDIFVLLPPLRFGEGIAIVGSVLRNGIREVVAEGGEILAKNAVDQLVRKGRAYVDEKTGELVVRQPQGAFLREIAVARKREVLVGNELKAAYPSGNIQREVYLRNADGTIVRGADGTARRIDWAVIENGEAKELVEVTSLTANKIPQQSKEEAIRDMGATFIRDRSTGQLVDVSRVITRLDRRP